MLHTHSLNREEEDDETIEWEQEQLRRGGHTTPDSSSKSAPVKQTYKPAPSRQSSTIFSIDTYIRRSSPRRNLTAYTSSNYHTSNSVIIPTNNISLIKYSSIECFGGGTKASGGTRKRNAGYGWESRGETRMVWKFQRMGRRRRWILG